MAYDPNLPAGEATAANSAPVVLASDREVRIADTDLVGVLSDIQNQAAALLGQKVWVRALDSTDEVFWVYSLQNSGTVLRRIGVV